MSLSECPCGGRIPLGPSAPNECARCGAGVFAAPPTAEEWEVAILRKCNSEQAAEIERLLAIVEWQPIETAPVMQQVLLCNVVNKWVCIGFIYPNSGPGYATHWMPVPAFPPTAPDQRGA
jgi:hypothetical protein